MSQIKKIMNWWKIAIIIQTASSYAFENYPSKFRKHFFFQMLGRTNIIFALIVKPQIYRKLYIHFYFRLWQIAANFWFSKRTKDRHWQSKLYNTVSSIYRISSYSCRGNYSFLNSSSEETIQVFISLM